MCRFGWLFVPIVLFTGCGHRYMLTGESDTSKPIAVSIMKTGHGEPQRLYYTELTGNDTEFVWDRFVDDREAQVEAWFTPKNRRSPSTIYALPPDQHVRLKLDIDDDRVVVDQHLVVPDAVLRARRAGGDENDLRDRAPLAAREIDVEETAAAQDDQVVAVGLDDPALVDSGFLGVGDRFALAAAVLVGGFGLDQHGRHADRLAVVVMHGHRRTLGLGIEMVPELDQRAEGGTRRDEGRLRDLRPGTPD